MRRCSTAHNTGYCVGFGVEALNKLSLSKSNDKSISMLDFVVRLCLVELPSVFQTEQTLQKELKYVSVAVRVEVWPDDFVCT